MPAFLFSGVLILSLGVLLSACLPAAYQDEGGMHPSDAEIQALEAALKAGGYETSVRYSLVDYVDLNGDGRLDALLRLRGRDYCGSGGCTALILENTGAAFRLIQHLPTSDAISAQETLSRGWRDVWVSTSGGGYPPALEKLAFDGTTYRLQATATIEQIARDFAQSAEIYVQDGHNLQLRGVAPTQDCEGCYRYLFSFEHYGDPQVGYSLTVDVKQGHPTFVPLWPAPALR